jgi:hypothetical protein
MPLKLNRYLSLLLLISLLAGAMVAEQMSSQHLNESSTCSSATPLHSPSTRVSRDIELNVSIKRINHDSIGGTRYRLQT